MIYPILKQKATLGVTAPSSGVLAPLHSLIETSKTRMEARGYQVIIGDTTWTQHKAKSAPAKKRAQEFQQLMTQDEIDFIFPPWGGELLIEILEFIDFSQFPLKWILGYSDVSVLLLATTLQTGMATAHGPNFVDMRGTDQDETTAMWETVLQTPTGANVTQHSSARYQEKWQHDNPTPHVFHLTESTEWKSVTGEDVIIEGRLLGGCIDVIRHLIGTPYGDVMTFRKKFTKGEPLIWYLENCELSVPDLRRSLVHMKLAGWFEGTSGLLFGRSSANEPYDGYTAEDVYKDLAEELGVPVIYDVDCGHVPPQMTLVNGALGEVSVITGRGRIKQFFV